MKLTAIMTTLTILAANPAAAQSKIVMLCGQGHVNEVAAHDDVLANPDGYYIRSLETQLSHGDPRIVRAVGTEFYVCTLSAATPEMDSTKAALMIKERTVKYLFVPICPVRVDTPS